MRSQGRISKVFLLFFFFFLNHARGRSGRGVPQLAHAALAPSMHACMTAPRGKLHRHARKDTLSAIFKCSPSDSCTSLTWHDRPGPTGEGSPGASMGQEETRV